MAGKGLSKKENVKIKNQRKSVFVIHGRNLKIVQYVKDTIESIGLNVIEWNEAKKATGKRAPSTLEIVKSGLRLAAAAVVVLTGDDYAKLGMRFWEKSDEEVSFNPQARPNVLFEAGMALAKLPKKTIFIQFGDIRPWSDVAGLNFIRVTKDNLESLKEKLRSDLGGSKPRSDPEIPDEQFYGYDYSDPFEVTTHILLPNNKEQPRTINVCKLLPVQPRGKPYKPLELPIETYAKGLGLIFDQITSGDPDIEYDLIIGVRHTGLSMASILAGMLGKRDNTPIAFVYPDLAHEINDNYSLIPDINKKNPRILITDGELKKGKSLKNLFDLLLEKNPKSIIHTAILCASCVKGTIQNMEDLRIEGKRTRDLLVTLKGMYPNQWEQELQNSLMPTWLAFVYEGRIKLSLERKRIH